MTVRGQVPKMETNRENADKVPSSANFFPFESLISDRYKRYSNVVKVMAPALSDRYKAGTSPFQNPRYPWDL